MMKMGEELDHSDKNPPIRVIRVLTGQERRRAVIDKQVSTKVEKEHGLANKRPYLTGFGPVLASVGQLDLSNLVDITIRGKYAYLLGQDLRILDLSVPGQPVEVGAYTGVVLSGVALAVAGNNVYLTTANCYYNHCSGELLIFDVSDPAQPRQLSRLEILGGGLDLSLVDDYAYVAAGEAGLWVVNLGTLRVRPEFWVDFRSFQNFGSLLPKILGALNSHNGCVRNFRTARPG